MILVIGGFSSGKKEYVKRTFGFEEGDFSTNPKDSLPVLFDLQELEIDICDDNIEELMKKKVIICNEVGCGVVPVDPKEAKLRERTGRLCTALAQKADSVIRVFCGIGTRIK